jgi:hypothetical protein
LKEHVLRLRVQLAGAELGEVDLAATKRLALIALGALCD